MGVNWKPLDGSEGMPTDDMYAVILFPCKTDCCVLYTISNPEYARGSYAKKAGYTHWAEFNLAPEHNYWKDWQESNQQ